MRKELMNAYGWGLCWMTIAFYLGIRISFERGDWAWSGLLLAIYTAIAILDIKRMLEIRVAIKDDKALFKP